MKKRSFAETAADDAVAPRISGHQKLGMAFTRDLRPKGTIRQSCPAVLLVPVLVLLALLVGCSSEPSKTAEPAKPEPKVPELLTGRSAFQKMFIAARGWARDAQPYRIESTSTSDANGRD